jgi:SAM-dependent methyltransferase
LGSKWQGEKPQRKLTLDRATEDLYEDGLSVSIELGELKEQTITTWLRYFPRGGEVWVDPDGASMAYVKGIARMVGWFGPEPDGDEHEVRGFVVPRDYEFTGNDVRDLESGKFLTHSSVDSVDEIIQELSKQLSPNGRISITDYGDIFWTAVDGVAKKITRAHKDTWFDGHLPGS